MEHWASLAPAMADPAHNFVFPHQVKERTVYFSAFQATACGLLRSTSICSGCLGLLIAVKKNIVYGNGRFNLGARWEADDPQNLFRWAFALELLLTPVGIFLIGPDSVYWLNEKGFTIGG